MIEWFRTGIYDTRLFTGDDPTVLVWTFSKTNDWKKYDAKGRLSRFLIQKIHTLRYCRDLVARWPEHYPLGLYAVPYYLPNWFLLVKPGRREREREDRMAAATTGSGRGGARRVVWS